MDSPSSPRSSLRLPLDQPASFLRTRRALNGRGRQRNRPTPPRRLLALTLSQGPGAETGGERSGRCRPQAGPKNQARLSGARDAPGGTRERRLTVSAPLGTATCVSTGGADGAFATMGSRLAGPGIALLLAVLLVPGRRSWSEAAGVSIAYLLRMAPLALLSPFSLHAAVSRIRPHPPTPSDPLISSLYCTLKKRFPNSPNPVASSSLLPITRSAPLSRPLSGGFLLFGCRFLPPLKLLPMQKAGRGNPASSCRLVLVSVFKTESAACRMHRSTICGSKWCTHYRSVGFFEQQPKALHVLMVLVRL